MENSPLNIEPINPGLIDVQTKKRISEHIKNEHDIITDEDIKNAKTDIGKNTYEEPNNKDDKNDRDQNFDNRTEIIEKIISIT